METILRFGLPMIVALVAGAAIWGAIRNQVKTNAKEISELRGSYNTLMGIGSNPGGESLFVRTGECAKTVREFKEEFEHIKVKIDKQSKSLRGMQNFARFLLTKGWPGMEGLPLEKVNEIVNGD